MMLEKMRGLVKEKKERTAWKQLPDFKKKMLLPLYAAKTTLIFVQIYGLWLVFVSLFIGFHTNSDVIGIQKFGQVTMAIAIFMAMDIIPLMLIERIGEKIYLVREGKFTVSEDMIIEKMMTRTRRGVEDVCVGKEFGTLPQALSWDFIPRRGGGKIYVVQSKNGTIVAAVTSLFSTLADSVLRKMVRPSRERARV